MTPTCPCEPCQCQPCTCGSACKCGEACACKSKVLAAKAD